MFSNLVLLKKNKKKKKKPELENSKESKQYF